MKIKKKNKKKIFFFFGGEGRDWGGQAGCDRRIEVFGKIHKKKSWGVGGVRWGVVLVVGLGGSGWM